MNAASIIVVVVIFSYAAWALVRSIRRSKEGKCAACSVKDGCSSSTCSTLPQDTPKLH